MQALQFCVAKGANVYVTSSKAEKIEQAKKYGAIGGANYQDSDWPEQLAALLPTERPSLDAVIDAAGGDIISALLKVLKFGARVVVYGQYVLLDPLPFWSFVDFSILTILTVLLVYFHQDDREATYFDHVRHSKEHRATRYHNGVARRIQKGSSIRC